ncbi:unnamed protein product [Trifolium pratense]|uniref:Uncharacterized protein n=1 Tax=Trifolium pratense TaxID=57577 RepID=A0ACB0KAX3_TRIPR|nr:unnamed protein product [Trifolium pratense]
MAKILKKNYTVIIFLFIFLIVVDIDEKPTVKAFLKICEHDSDCLRSMCNYPKIVRCINKSCECVRMMSLFL